MDFLDLTPVDVTSFLGILDPGQLRIGLDHCVDALAYALLIDLFHINAQTVDGLNGNFAFGHQFALAKGLVSCPFAFCREPRCTAFVLGVAFVVEVFHALEIDCAATVDQQVIATVQFGNLIPLVAATCQR
ncbi:hypothetical protein ALP54_200057 [Pseudomonas amygdali pv. lachrymans]|nr:hypothetical protein ALP54_200057 [Pseudomonas amygdali pv. lachrymans]